MLNGLISLPNEIFDLFLEIIEKIVQKSILIIYEYEYENTNQLII